MDKKLRKKNLQLYTGLSYKLSSKDKTDPYKICNLKITFRCHGNQYHNHNYDVIIGFSG